jgi:glycosyltransferase involved in cell wall biosynthesis
MCQEKGLPTLVDGFIELKRRNRVPGLRLRIGGGLSPVDEASLVIGLKAKLQAAGLAGEVDFCPNLTREQKLEFYRSLSVLSVPALFGEAFGLYLVEAWASGVPVVQPRHAAFPELIELSGGGALCDPGDPRALAEAIETLLLDKERSASYRWSGRQAAASQFSIDRMAQSMIRVFESLSRPAAQPALRLD